MLAQVAARIKLELLRYQRRVKAYSSGRKRWPRQGFWQAVMDMGIKEARLETGEVEGHGDTAIEVSTFSLLGEGGQVLDEGKYIVVWKQEGGGWKLHRDIFNSSLPAPGTP